MRQFYVFLRREISTERFRKYQKFSRNTFLIAELLKTSLQGTHKYYYAEKMFEKLTRKDSIVTRAYNKEINS
jgi:hypothetical protein